MYILNIDSLHRLINVEQKLQLFFLMSFTSDGADEKLMNAECNALKVSHFTLKIVISYHLHVNLNCLSHI